MPLAFDSVSSKSARSSVELADPRDERTYPVFILDQALVVSTDGHEEEQAVDVFETVDPLLSF